MSRDFHITQLPPKELPFGAGIRNQELYLEECSRIDILSVEMVMRDLFELKRTLYLTYSLAEDLKFRFDCAFNELIENRSKGEFVRTSTLQLTMGSWSFSYRFFFIVPKGSGPNSKHSFVPYPRRKNGTGFVFSNIPDCTKDLQKLIVSVDEQLSKLKLISDNFKKKHAMAMSTIRRYKVTMDEVNSIIEADFYNYEFSQVPLLVPHWFTYGPQRPTKFDPKNSPSHSLPKMASLYDVFEDLPSNMTYSDYYYGRYED